MLRSPTPDALLAAAPAATMVGTVLQENYRIDAVLRGGAQFTIYEAEHLRLGRRVAVKCLSSHLVGSDVAVRFEKEVQLLSLFRHPHIVAMVDFDSTIDGRPYAVMEFLDGKTLFRHISDRRKFTEPEIIELVTQVGSALGAAHAQSVVHGALTPANVVLLGQDKDIFAKVIGFDSSLQGTKTDKDDQYDLGVLLYELLTGRPMTGVPSTRGIPDVLVPLVLRALHRDAAQRFDSVLSLCAALRRATGLESHRPSLSPPRESGPRPMSLKVGKTLDLVPPTERRRPLTPGSGTKRAHAPTSPESLLEHARMEAVLGKVHTALGCIRDVLEDAEGEETSRGEAIFRHAEDVLRSIVRLQCGSASAAVRTAANLRDRSSQLKLTPEDAYLLSIIEVGMALDRVVDMSPMTTAETWLRINRLLVRGLLTAS